jgi:hypothetical protein
VDDRSLIEPHLTDARETAASPPNSSGFRPPPTPGAVEVREVGAAATSMIEEER